MVKNPPANTGDMRHRFDTWVGKIPWRKKWQPTPVFLPGKSCGWRSLVNSSSWGCMETSYEQKFPGNPHFTVDYSTSDSNQILEFSWVQVLFSVSVNWAT